MLWVRPVSDTASRVRHRTSAVMPLADESALVAYLGREMAAGRLRSGNPRLVLSLAYATVAGIATEPEALRAVGWEPSVAGIRRLRSELLAFLRAALAPPGT